MEAPISAGALSIDLRRADFAAGDSVVGTIHITFALGQSGTIPSQTVTLGGGFTDTITFVRR
jgi:hypothetical protein